MKRVAQSHQTRRVTYASTASFGDFLYWTSHYAQSPLTALRGYLEMIPQPSYLQQSAEIIANAQHCSERTQAVLSSIAALHKLVGSGGTTLNLEPTDLNAELRQIHWHLKPTRTRSKMLPCVLLESASFQSGFGIVVQQLAELTGARSASLSFRQRDDAFILHLHTSKLNPRLSRQLGALLQIVRGGRYPLPSGELIPLAAGIVLLHSSGVHLITRPTKPGSIDMYLHLTLVRQLELPVGP